MVEIETKGGGTVQVGDGLKGHFLTCAIVDLCLRGPVGCRVRMVVGCTRTGRFPLHRTWGPQGRLRELVAGPDANS